MKIILLVCAALIVVLWLLLSCALKPTLEMRPMLATDAIVYINGAEAPNSVQIIEELNALRVKKWQKFHGKVSAGQVTLAVKSRNSDEVVRFSLYANSIEEYGGRNSGLSNSTGYSNTSGGYAYRQFSNSPALEHIVETKRLESLTAHE